MTKNKYLWLLVHGIKYCIIRKTLRLACLYYLQNLVLNFA